MGCDSIQGKTNNTKFIGLLWIMMAAAITTSCIPQRPSYDHLDLLFRKWVTARMYDEEYSDFREWKSHKEFNDLVALGKEYLPIMTSFMRDSNRWSLYLVVEEIAGPQPWVEQRVEELKATNSHTTVDIADVWYKWFRDVYTKNNEEFKGWFLDLYYFEIEE